MNAQPILKSAGGKRTMAARILAHAPPVIGRYIEPFAGGAAVFFALRSAGYTGPAILNDLNAEFINAYRVVRDFPDRLLEALRTHQNTREHYDQVAAMSPRRLLTIQRASRILYLNKTAHAGLYRVNSKGRYNAPFGNYARPNWVNEAGIRTASLLLAGVQLEIVPFEALEAEVRAGDFVFCDPPYPGGFTGYTAKGFTSAQQALLKHLAIDWAARGATVVLTNADCKEIRDLYGDTTYFEIERVPMRRSINANKDARGPVGELLIRAKGKT